MAKLMYLLYFVATLYAFMGHSIMARGAQVIPVTLQLLNEIQSNRTIPVPWVIRFVSPGGQNDKEKAAFNDAAMLVDSAVANFGLYTVDTYDKARYIENMGIRQLPATRFVQYKAARPTGPKTSLTGRTTFVGIELPSNAVSEEIVRTALVQTSMRYHHPVSTQPIPAVTYVVSLEDMAARAKFSLPDNSGDAGQDSLSSLSGGVDKAIGVLFYFHLMKKNHLSYHAEINSFAARMGPRVTVFATEDADIAKRFGLTTTFSAAAFKLKEVNIDTNPQMIVGPDGKKISAPPAKFPDVIKTIATADELANNGALSSFGEEFALLAADYEKAYNLEMHRWHRDIGAYYSKSPLIKITHSSQFNRDIMGNKASVTVLFLLREADKHFNKYHRTAVDFAMFVRDPLRVAPVISKKLHQNLNLQTFWIDGEIQDSASRFLKAQTVPSIAFLMHTQSGSTAVKYFTFSDDDKKRRKKQGKDVDWPDVQDLMMYVSSEALLQNSPTMSAFMPEEVQFNDDPSLPAAPATSTLINSNRYLFIDRRHNNMGEEKPNDFLEELSAGKITVDADHYAKEGTPKQTKKSKKAIAKEEARKKKLQEELERKAKEREERTRLKEEADRKRREEDAAKTKALITAKAREDAKKGGGKKSVVEGETVTAPKLQDGRLKKDFNVWAKGWEADKRKMADKFVKNVKGGLRVGKGLGLPDWKKK